jgi:hypothetical protein
MYSATLSIIFQNSSANLTLTNTISVVNMWNFIKGVKNPNLKRDRPKEKCQQDSLYDQEKRIRTFQESWKAMLRVFWSENVFPKMTVLRVFFSPFKYENNEI